MAGFNVDQVFTYHAPFGTQPERYVAIREAAKTFAKVIEASCPNSREKSLAFTDLQRAVQMANAAIAINEKAPAAVEAPVVVENADTANWSGLGAGIQAETAVGADA